MGMKGTYGGVASPVGVGCGCSAGSAVSALVAAGSRSALTA